MGTRLWQAIGATFHAFGLVANLFILAIFYFLIFGPFALVVRLLGRDFLGLRRGERETFWTTRRAEEPSLERAKRQA